MSKEEWEKRKKKVPLSLGFQTIPEELVFTLDSHFFFFNHWDSHFANEYQ